MASPEPHSASAKGQSIPPDEIVRSLTKVPERWRKRTPHGWLAAATVLGPDAALVALASHNGQGKLVAYNRADGKSLWTLPLPNAPIHNGLALAPNRRIVVALRNGQVTCVSTPPPPAKCSPRPPSSRPPADFVMKLILRLAAPIDASR